jgi:hypothetical protein
MAGYSLVLVPAQPMRLTRILALSLLRCFAPAILPRRRQRPTAVARRLGRRAGDRLGVDINPRIALGQVGVTSTSGPELPTRCGDRCSPGLCQAFELDRCRHIVPSRTRSSRGVAARPVSNLVSIRGFRSRPVADACGAPVLRDQGLGRPAWRSLSQQSRAAWARSELATVARVGVGLEFLDPSAGKGSAGGPRPGPECRMPRCG